MDNKLIENEKKFKEEYYIGYTTKILENIIVKFNLHDLGHAYTKDSKELKDLVKNLDKYNNNKLNVKIVTIVKAQMMRIINNELDTKEVEITKGFTLDKKESQELEDLIVAIIKAQMDEEDDPTILNRLENKIDTIKDIVVFQITISLKNLIHAFSVHEAKVNNNKNKLDCIISNLEENIMRNM
ncbi:MAG: hypothetical protein Q4B63_06445 [Clostridium perfringens]|nr:hypothetical protein [Clostridium perfringens]